MRNTGSGGGVATPSSKIAQMASIFQTGDNTGGGGAGAAPSVTSNRHTLPMVSGQQQQTTSASASTATTEARRASKVTVQRTESHHERFSSARALFERMGSGDNLLEEARSRQSSVLTSPSGSRTSSVSGVVMRPGSRTDSESRSSVNIRSRSSSPLGHESRSSSVSSTAEFFKNMSSSCQQGDETRMMRHSVSSSSPSKHPPDKPERKINAREAISKQRNWFSNFEKSKTGTEVVDSPRRASVNKENTPGMVSGGGQGSPSKGYPLSPNHQPRIVSPKTSDSIEAYMQNWKKSPSGSEPW